MCGHTQALTFELVSPQIEGRQFGQQTQLARDRACAHGDPHLNSVCIGVVLHRQNQNSHSHAPVSFFLERLSDITHPSSSASTPCHLSTGASLSQLSLFFHRSPAVLELILKSASAPTCSRNICAQNARNSVYHSLEAVEADSVLSETEKWPIRQLLADANKKLEDVQKALGYVQSC